MYFEVYWKCELTCAVTVGGGSVSFTNFTDDPIKLPFGVRETVSIADVESFFEYRCFPRERENCKTVLKSIGLDYYEPEAICRKTHGTQWDDYLWVRFDNEDICYSDVKLRD